MRASLDLHQGHHPVPLDAGDDPGQAIARGLASRVGGLGGQFGHQGGQAARLYLQWAGGAVVPLESAGLQPAPDGIVTHAEEGCSLGDPNARHDPYATAGRDFGGSSTAALLTAVLFTAVLLTAVLFTEGMHMDAGRVAIVTGGARGIGAAIARRLSQDGFAVAVADLEQSACEPVVGQITGAGGRAAAVAVDVADEGSVAAAVEQVAAVLGPPLVLINNAGITRDNLLFKMSVEDWDAVMGVHLRGAFLMSRAAQAHMTSAGWGRIVNLSSTSALGNRGQANYATAKAGLQGMTKTLAIELGKFGITVNAIAPGFIETDMTRATATRLGIDFEDMKKFAAAEIPVARVGQPEDIAAAASFFCREDAGFVSGQVLYVAGGPKA